MRIGIDIDGQFINMTGIQHSVDALIEALYTLGSAHEISAFASHLPSLDAIESAAEKNPGTFLWRNLPNAHLDVWNEPPTLIPKTFKRDHPWLSGKIRQREHRALHGLAKGPEKRARTYDVLHIPEAFDMRFEQYRTKHAVATIYDISTLLTPAGFKKQGISYWTSYFKWARDRCDAVIVISESTKRDVIERLEIGADRLFVTPLSARASARAVPDSPERQATLAKWRLAGRPFLLYAGTLEPRKNLETLVRSFAALVQQEPSLEHQLVLAGGNWERLDLELRLLACELGIGGRVVTTGYVTNDELNTLMSACEAFVYISKYEGFGMPPLEAMVCGAPVIVSNTSSMPEVVGDAGILVSPTDEEAVSAAMHRLLTDSEENARRRELSTARAAYFTWGRTARLTLQAYEAAANA